MWGIVVTLGIQISFRAWLEVLNALSQPNDRLHVAMGIVRVLPNVRGWVQSLSTRTLLGTFLVTLDST